MHPTFPHLLPRHCPHLPSTFRTRDCLAREPVGLQQVLGKTLVCSYDLPLGCTPAPFPLGMVEEYKES